MGQFERGECGERAASSFYLVAGFARKDGRAKSVDELPSGKPMCATEGSGWFSGPQRTQLNGDAWLEVERQLRDAIVEFPAASLRGGASVRTVG